MGDRLGTLISTWLMSLVIGREVVEGGLRGWGGRYGERGNGGYGLGAVEFGSVIVMHGWRLRAQELRGK